MKVPVYWMVDPEADAIKSPFVRQPHYNDLENRIRELEAALDFSLQNERRANATADRFQRERDAALDRGDEHG